MTIDNSLKLKNIKSKKYINNPKHFFIIFVIISFVIAFIIGGFILGHNKTKKQSSSLIETEQIITNINDIPDNPNSWKSYQINSVSLKFKLPEKLSKNKNWQINEFKKDKGSRICFSENKSSFDCKGNILVIGGSSTNYLSDTDASFTELQGFVKDNDVYFVYSSPTNLIPLKNVEVKEYVTENGLKILKILGTNNANNPVPGTPGQGYLGAIVNTNNSKYPGLSFQYSLESDLTEYEFDQILNSIIPIK